MQAEIHMLGTGNAFLPHGRHHSFLCFDEKYLIDMPPTALASLRKAGISPAQIEAVFFTHIHGDHVFGFPFFLLERKYISDREGARPLTIYGEPGVKERLWELCELAYPESLEDIFNSVEFIESKSGELANWQFERFKVHHDECADPHGYRFENEETSFVHSGDSGPCDTLYQAIARSDLCVIEMSIPEWVESDKHHKPSHIVALAKSNPDCAFLLTHTYVDTPGVCEQQILTDQYPEMPENVIHGEDGMKLKFEQNKWV